MLLIFISHYQFYDFIFKIANIKIPGGWCPWGSVLEQIMKTVWQSTAAQNMDLEKRISEAQISKELSVLIENKRQRRMSIWGQKRRCNTLHLNAWKAGDCGQLCFPKMATSPSTLGSFSFPVWPWRAPHDSMSQGSFFSLLLGWFLTHGWVGNIQFRTCKWRLTFKAGLEMTLHFLPFPLSSSSCKLQGSDELNCHLTGWGLKSRNWGSFQDFSDSVPCWSISSTVWESLHETMGTRTTQLSLSYS